MNPKYGLMGILGVVGVILLFGRICSISFSSGSLNEFGPEAKLCDGTPRWISVLLGLLCLAGAVVVAYFEFVR